MLTKNTIKAFSFALFTVLLSVNGMSQSAGVNSNAADSLLFFSGGSKTAVLTADGKLRLGTIQTTSRSSILQLNSTTGGLLIPRVTTVQRDAFTNDVEGNLIYNTTTGTFQIYHGAAWDDVLTATGLSSPATLSDGDSDTQVQVEQSADEDKIRFNTAGTERMVIDENGNIGVGVQPVNTFEIANSTNVVQTLITANDANSSALILSRTRGNLGAPTAVTMGTSLGELGFAGFDGTASQIGAIVQALPSENYTGSAWGTDLLFYTTPNGTTSFNEVMRMSNAGNIGIGGIVAPSVALDMNGQFAQTETVTGSAAPYYGNDKFFDLSSGTQSAEMSGVVNIVGITGSAVTTGDLANSTAVSGGQNLVSISSTGTTNEVAGAVNAVWTDPTAGNNTTSYGTFSMAGHDASGSTMTNAIGSANFVENSNTGTITNAQGVYVGIQNTGAGTITNAQGVYVDDISAGAGTNHSIITSAGDVLINQGNNNASAFQVKTQGNDYMLYTDPANDRVGIGTGSPTRALDVNGSIKVTPLGTAPATPLQGDIYSNSADGNLYHYNGSAWEDLTVGGGSPAWELAGNPGTNPASDLLGTTDAQDLAIGTNGAERMRITSGGDIGIGTSAPLVQVHVANEGGADAHLGIMTAGTGTSTLSMLTSPGSLSGPTPTPVGQKLAHIGLNGHDGSNYQESVTIEAYASENWGVGNNGAELVFTTTPNGSAASTEVMRLTERGSIGIGTNSPDVSSILELNTTSEGILIPRMTQAQRDGIGSPAQGLLVYNLDYNQFNYYDGAAWEVILDQTSSGAWVDAGSDVHLSDDNDFVGIGTATPMFKTHIVDEGQANLMVHTYENGVEASIGLVNTGGDVGAETAPQSGDILGSMYFMGYTPGDGFMEAAMIRAEAAENFSSGGSGSVLDFRTSPIGATSAQDRMRITENGDVGIGTQDINGRLHVQTDDDQVGGVVVQTASSTGSEEPYVYLVKSRGSAGAPLPVAANDMLGGISWNGHDGTDIFDGASVRARATEAWAGAAHGTELTFETVANGTTSVTERMVITNDGLVGIGTNSPLGLLHVADNAPTGVISQVSSDAAAIDAPYFAQYRSRGSVGAETAVQSGDILGQMIYMSHNGTSPGDVAYVRSNATENHAAGSRGSNLEFFTTANTTGSPTSRMIIDQNGYVGIGVAAPTEQLAISDNGENVPALLSLDHGASDDFSAVYLEEGGTLGASIGQFGSGYAIPAMQGDVQISNQIVGAGDINFNVNNNLTNPAMTVQWDGNVGIGTINPAAALVVQRDGATNAVEFKSLTNASTMKVYLDRARAGETTMSSGTTMGSLVGRGYDGTSYVPGAEISFVSDGTLGANDMPGMIQFRTTADGASATSVRMVVKNDGKVGVGTTAPGFKFDVNGDARIGYHGNSSTIPLYPSDFMVESPGGGTPFLMTETHVSSGTYGVSSRTNGTNLVAIIKLPVGYQVDEVTIYGDGPATGNPFEVREVDLTNGTYSGDLTTGTGTVDGTAYSLSISPAYNPNKYVAVYIDNSSGIIYGGHVNISQY